MPLIAWNEKLSVGVASLDAEHQKLLALLNEFYDATHAGKDAESLGNILNALVEYTKFHFAHEEQCLAKAGYPSLADHKKLHEDLTRQVLEKQQQFKSGSHRTLSLELMTFLKNWLLNHIQSNDKKYGSYLNRKGVH